MHRYQHCLLVAVGALLIHSISIEAAVTKGTTDSDNGFQFGGKFCFQALPDPQVVGVIDVDLSLPIYAPPAANASSNSTVQIVMYDDADFSWPTLLDNWDSWSCQQKVAGGRFSLSFSQCVPGAAVDCWQMNSDQTAYTLSTSVQGIHQNTRPRFWFLSFAKCDTGFANLDYHLHFLQAQQSSWNQEFGSNINGLNTLYLVYFFVFTILLVTHGYGTYKLSQQLQYLHPMVKLFLIVLLLEYLSIFALLVHYGTYARDGIGIVSLCRLGEILDLVSRCTFVFLLILVAKGWTISSERLEHRWIVLVIVLSYLAGSIGILLWGASFQDDKTSVAPSAVVGLTIFINVLWLFFGFWFVVQSVLSYRKEENPDKKSMYLKIGIIFGPWMLLPPLASFLTFAMDPWARDRVVIAFTVTITTLAYSILSFLFWPSRAEKYFSIATPDVMGVNSGYDQL